jgi:rod shape determining protein RodA
MIGIPFILIAEQPDLGTSLLILASGIFVLFLSGLSWKMIRCSECCCSGYSNRLGIFTT